VVNQVEIMEISNVDVVVGGLNVAFIGWTQYFY